MRYIKTLFLLFVSSNLSAQNSLIGKPAPDLEFSKILNDQKTSAKLSDFKSKIVIIDFWATWCGPCIESLPHLEQLQQTFGNDVRVITVTDESPARIEKFLQKRKLNLPVVIDENGKLANIFPHRSIPHTVVIDKNGIVASITSSAELNESVLRKMIAGQVVNLPEKKDAMDFDPSKPLSSNENFLYQITVTPYQAGLPSMANPTGGKGIYKGRRILCTNLSAKSLYEIAYQYPVGIRTIVEVKNRPSFDWSKENAICLDLIVPEELGEKRFEIMKQHLAYLYPFKPSIQKRTVKAMILKVADGGKATLTPAHGGAKEVTYGGSGLSMKNAGTNSIAEFLESQLNVPVVDETGQTGLYDLELPWYNENPSQINAELKKLGLELKEETKPIDVLVIADN